MSTGSRNWADSDLPHENSATIIITHISHTLKSTIYQAMIKKALTLGTVIKGVKHSYRITDVLQNDGQGFTYKTIVTVGAGARSREIPMVLREHMMVRCSDRGPDGMAVVTPDDIAPTVDGCLKSFEYASLERAKLSGLSPWLINVIETFPGNNTYYYAVEFLDGQTFEEYVESKGGRLTFEQCREVLSPIFDAVRLLHAHHVLHTDIHPGHIRFLKTSKGLTPVLFSLYATLHFSDHGLQDWTLPVMNCKEGYAPPEQYGSIDHFYPQIDIYALASLLVYALSGNTLPDSRLVNEEVIRSTLPQALPESLVSAIISALDPDVNQRTASISNFREDLREFQRSSVAEAMRPATDDDSDDYEATTFASVMRRHWWKLLAGAGAIGGLLYMM